MLYTKVDLNFLYLITKLLNVFGSSQLLRWETIRSNESQVNLRVFIVNLLVIKSSSINSAATAAAQHELRTLSFSSPAPVIDT